MTVSPATEPAAGADRPDISPVEPTRSDLTREILHETPTFTSVEVIEAAHASTKQARRLWRALGFADAGDATAFTVADKEAMELVLSLVDRGVLDFESAVRAVRALGYTMARLADWQVSALSEHVDDVQRTGGGAESRLSAGLEFLRSVDRPFEQLMLYAWRRHLAAVIDRTEALDLPDADIRSQLVTVGFIDLVSFTQLSTGTGREELAGLVEQFESVCSDLVARRSGRVIKTLGDSVLFVADDPRTAVDVAWDVVDRIGGDPGLPDVHAGLATGPVIVQLGDVFGPSVNLASRLTDVARRNRVICDESTARALRDVAGYTERALMPRVLRGFSRIQPYAVRRIGTDADRIASKGA